MGRGASSVEVRVVERCIEDGACAGVEGVLLLGEELMATARRIKLQNE